MKHHAQNYKKKNAKVLQKCVKLIKSSSSDSDEFLSVLMNKVLMKLSDAD